MKKSACATIFFKTPTNPATFYFFEEYTDDEGYAAHRAMPYMPPFRDFRGTVVEEYLGIRVLDEIASH